MQSLRDCPSVTAFALFGKGQLLLDLEAGGARGSSGLRLSAADRDAVLSLGDDNVSSFGDHAQLTRLQMKFDPLTRARRQMDALKATQRAKGSTRTVGKFQVQLRDLVSSERPSVGDRDGDVQRLARIELCLRHRQGPILKLCI